MSGLERGLVPPAGIGVKHNQRRAHVTLHRFVTPRPSANRSGTRFRNPHQVGSRNCVVSQLSDLADRLRVGYISSISCRRSTVLELAVGDVNRLSNRERKPRSLGSESVFGIGKRSDFSGLGRCDAAIPDNHALGASPNSSLGVDIGEMWHAPWLAREDENCSDAFSTICAAGTPIGRGSARHTPKTNMVPSDPSNGWLSSRHARPELGRR